MQFCDVSLCVAVCVLDSRMGRVLHRWQAHEFPVVNVFPMGGDVLSVAGDHTAQLWPCRGWNTPVVDSKLLCKNITLPQGVVEDTDGLSHRAVGDVVAPFSTPTRVRSGRDADSVSVLEDSSGIAATRTRTGGSRPATQTLPSKEPAVTVPPRHRASSQPKIDNDGGTRSRAALCIDGVLGGGNAVSLWKPLGSSGPVHLLSADGAQVAMSVVQVGAACV